MKTTILFLLMTLSVTAQKNMVLIEGFQEQDFVILRGTVSERFVKNANTVITVHAQKQGSVEWISATFIVDDVCNYYRLKNEYVFLLEVNQGSYDFNYTFIKGVYSPKQTREIIASFEL